MEKVASKVGTQPGLSVTNEEIAEQFPSLVTIPDGKESGVVFVGAIGEVYEGNDGKEYIPITLVQGRNDLYEASKSEANSFFRGWEGFESVVRHTENVPPARFKQMKMETGTVIKGAGIFVDYALEPFFTNSAGEDQSSVMNPSTEMFLVVDQKPLYRNTRIQFKENCEHTGLNLRNKASEVSEEDLENLESESDTVFTL